MLGCAATPHTCHKTRRRLCRGAGTHAHGLLPRTKPAQTVRCGNRCAGVCAPACPRFRAARPAACVRAHARSLERHVSLLHVRVWMRTHARVPFPTPRRVGAHVLTRTWAYPHAGATGASSSPPPTRLPSPSCTLLIVIFVHVRLIVLLVGMLVRVCTSSRLGRGAASPPTKTGALAEHAAAFPAPTSGVWRAASLLRALLRANAALAAG